MKDKQIKKLLIKLLILIASVFAVVFANGCYFVFCHQEKSMQKIQQGRELNLYECCSIYTMHMAVWMFGWPLSPAAANAALKMHFKTDTGYRWYSDTSFTESEVITSTPNWKTKIPFKVSWSTDLTQISKEELKYALAYNTNDTQVLFSQYGNPILVYKVEYQNVKYQFGPIPIYTGLFKYLQKINWLYPYKVTNCSVTTYFEDILGFE